MILLILTTFLFSADGGTIFLEFGGMSKTCLTADTACHSLDQAVKHANWEDVTSILIQGHAELIGEVIFDSGDDTFKKTPAANIEYTMTLQNHHLSSNTDIYGLTGLGTVRIKGTDTSEMRLNLQSNVVNPTLNEPAFIISTSRTPGGEKKDYVFQVEQYGALELLSTVYVFPLQLPSTTTFTKLTSKFETEPWDKNSAAIIVDKGAIMANIPVHVYDPELGVLVLKDIDVANSGVLSRHEYSTSLTSFVPKGIVCSIPDNATSTFIIKIGYAGKERWEEDKLVGIDQYPLDIHLSGKCKAYNFNDVDKKFPLNNTDMTNISKTAFVFPSVSLSRSNIKFATKTGSQSDELGNNLLAEFTSKTNSLGVAALDRLKVSIAPRYHTEDADDKLIRWDEMTWYVGLWDTKMNEGGVTIKQSGQSGFAVAAVPRANVGISGEYTVKMEFGDQVRYVGCLYSGARKTVAFASVALLVAVLLGF
ncbi:hypothetical protein BLNAU_24014 [Blattamonas nauphoetae]|uniref:Uncharacterized protein n=1 Tax=Blattamonas nauphoetae TaxID=2049346 RepID=A0ABQ9WQM2_9EUKA|nr:hypothetical protein BLNAU_24014 [Blattamonas nauphoetae]